MKKRIFVMFFLLALAVGMYAMTAQAKPQAEAAPGPTSTAHPPTMTATSTPSGCVVVTGFDNGAVNLRGCAGTSCGVIRILTEGERLTVTTAGAWLGVTTKDGVTGYINSTYCKGK